MGDLAIQDTFEPYYAGRDGFAKKPSRKTSEKPEDTTKPTPQRKKADNDTRADDRSAEH